MDYTEYDKILADCKDENEVQRYLEKNGHLLPVGYWILTHQVHYAVVITKLKLGNKYVTDFVYLSKNSIKWYVVFVEIENPKKRIFNKDFSFTSDFNKAYEQIQSWERYLNDSNNKSKLLNSFSVIRHPQIMRNDNVSFKYLLVYGRKEERDRCQEGKEKFLQKCNDSIQVCTYDSVKSSKLEQSDYMVLSSKGENKFEVKYVPKDFEKFDQGFFARCTAENIIITDDCVEQLKKQGYDMDSWLEGRTLISNNKYADDKLLMGCYHI